MTVDTALSREVRARFEQAVTDVMTEAREGEPRPVREVPAPAVDAPVEIDVVSELERISVSAPPERRVPGVNLDFSPIPDTDVPIVPESTTPEIRASLAFSTGDMVPTRLGDVGVAYARLSEAVTDTLASYCDALEADPSVAFEGDRADPVCARYLGTDRCRFAARITYPEYVADVYANDLCEQARRLGIPC